jgi:hypothetical protein
MKAVVTYDDFVPGQILGETTESFDPALTDGWQRIFGARPEDGAGGAAEGAGIAVVMMMRAYLAVVTPRPPGNIHGRQAFALVDAPRLGERIRTVVTCVDKQIKRDRRQVELQTQGTGEGGRLICTGRMTLIWAA